MREFFRRHRPAVRELMRKYGQPVVNWIVFIGIGRWVVVKGIEFHEQNQLWDFVNLIFLVHMAVLLVLVVIRTRHLAIDRSPLRQGVALAAFFSGLGYSGGFTESVTLLWAAKVVAAAALVLGILTQLNLGRSFGILIALRRIKTDWLYGVIRHPMYFTDILFSVSMVLKLPSLRNVAVFVFVVACYVTRALMEEKFLSQSEEYRGYMKRVRYRFLPGIF